MYENAGVRWIREPRDVKSIRGNGDLFRTNRFLIWISTCRSSDKRGPAVAVVTGKGFRSAVERNLAKRRVRGCILDLRQILKPGRCYLVECRPGVESEKYQNLVNSLKEVLLIV